MRSLRGNRLESLGLHIKPRLTPHLIVDAPGGDPLSIGRLQARLEPCGDVIGNGP